MGLILVTRMKFYFATQLSPDQEQVNTLTDAGAFTKLVSYLYLKWKWERGALHNLRCIDQIEFFLKTHRNKKGG